jgi:hypothetical protein
MLLTIRAAKAAQAPDTSKRKIEFSMTNYTLDSATGIATSKGTGSGTGSMGYLLVTNMPNLMGENKEFLYEELQLHVRIKYLGKLDGNKNPFAFLENNSFKTRLWFTAGSINQVQLTLQPKEGYTSNTLNVADKAETEVWYDITYSYNKASNLNKVTILKDGASWVEAETEWDTVFPSQLWIGHKTNTSNQCMVDTEACWFQIR